MTNPNDAVGTNAAFDGRTSVKAFNDIAGCFSSAGILSGWECAPDSGMFVVLGGNGTTRDVALAENNTGDKTTINNRSGQPIQLEIAAAPAIDSRIDAIVAYVTTPPTGTSTVADNPATVGLIDVVGVEDPSPVAPDDNAIRTAISADGGSGATAYYVILAFVTVANGTTDITNNMISAGASATLNSTHIADGSITSEKVDLSTFTRKVYQRNLIGTYIDADNKKHDLYRIYYYFSDTIAAGGYVTHSIGLSDCNILSVDFNIYRTDAAGVINIANDSGIFSVVFTNNGDNIRIMNNTSQAQTLAPITGVIECYKKAEQS